jgi:hypothetical protein
VQVLPQEIRGLGLGATLTLYWTIAFCNAQFLDSLVQGIGEVRTFSILAGNALLALLVAVLLIPETAGTDLGGGVQA